MSIARLAGKKATTVPAVLTSAVGESHAIRFVLTDRCVSFPFGLLERWERSETEEMEVLKIFIGRQQVKVSGRGLEVLHDALDAGMARLVQVGTGQKSGEGQIRIAEITLTVSPARADGFF